MANRIKNQEEILAKMNIPALNPMQEEALTLIEKTANVILLSPTGTGKTLAFLLPIIQNLDPDCKHIQALVLVPSRELAIQIEQVMRNMGSGFKVNAVYGGRAMSKDYLELKHPPALLVGTPGRVSDHFHNDRVEVSHIKTIVLDEFDKSLEVGFEKQMKRIIHKIPKLDKRILTSATQGVVIPDFIQLDSPKTLDYLQQSNASSLEIKMVVSPTKNKMQTLVDLLLHLGNQPGIVFCNFRDSIAQLSDILYKNKISHVCFSGGMEQRDRERSLIKFRNGTAQLLVATDLAARGIDIPEIQFIIHYEHPRAVEEFIHRNGRTARVNAKGAAYVLYSENEYLPEFIKKTAAIDISQKKAWKSTSWTTLFISGGRKDKISKGDIAGLFFKEGKLTKDQLGVIELKQDCAFVSVSKQVADTLVDQLNNSRLKKKKVRVYRI
ncbi:MAG: DEAD/DEAH box helicase [Flavobacteriaceae bacterium]|nr:DEAD/DEAH box helicase [Flavobacteriaceae bacterium]